MKKAVLAAKKVVTKAKTVPKQAVKVVKKAAKKVTKVVTSSGFLRAVSTALDFFPVVGNAKSAVEAIIGVDPITGRKLETWEQAVSVAGIVGGPLAKGVKHGGQAVTRFAKINDNAKNKSKQNVQQQPTTPTNTEKSNVTKGTSKKKPLKEYEVTTYKDFRDRSVVGDNLEGHELWQHANLKANGLATTRLSTDVSKNNPVIVLTNKQHKFINNAQRNIDAANQSPLENIMSNSKILRDAGISEDIVNDITEKALNHMKNTIKRNDENAK